MRKRKPFRVEFVVAALVFSGVPAPAFADAVVYVSNGSQFGTVDLATGAFEQIGPDLPDASQGLGYAANGSLLTMGFSGNLDAINPATGVMTTVGPSGLSPCPPACDSASVNSLVNFNGKFYATDFANRLYSVNQTTGSATLIGPTGMPALPFVPLSTNPDGTLNVYDEALFGANGKLFATFDAATLNLSTGTPTQVIAPELYQIDPATGTATLVAPTTFGVGAAAQVNGTIYAFLAAGQEIATLDLSTGDTTVIGPYDPNAGIISAAVPTPEPLSAAITGCGLGLVGLLIRRRF
jgi:outer membrane protein assembly factor BamB